MVRAAEGTSCSAGRFQGAHERIGRLGGPEGLEAASLCTGPGQVPGQRDQPLEGGPGELHGGQEESSEVDRQRVGRAAGPARSLESPYLQYSFLNSLSKSMFLAGGRLWASSALSFRMLFL